MHYDFDGDGTFEESLLYNLDTEGFDLSDFAPATVTSPADGAPGCEQQPHASDLVDAVPEADFMLVSVQAIEPDSIQSKRRSSTRKCRLQQPA
ncbi:MAG: hypothetical protein R3C05_22375 [Pirellulaceae bacterium]